MGKVRRPANGTAGSAALDKQAAGLLGLLTEYTEKVNHLRSASPGGPAWASDPRVTEFLFRKLQPVVRELAQYASQQIEYADHDELTRLELRLRLAELEAGLAAYEQVRRMRSSAPA
ncbi:MAG: hypothetical protein K2X87_08535 [Gemmataceae bacterium]|nr:hypothetical protein [Gemmataceae bacterium]